MFLREKLRKHFRLLRLISVAQKVYLLSSVVHYPELRLHTLTWLPCGDVLRLIWLLGGFGLWRLPPIELLVLLPYQRADIFAENDFVFSIACLEELLDR